MNVKKVIKQLKEQYPGKPIIQNMNDAGEVTEILCEVEPSSDHPDWSFAIAVLDSSTPHVHKKTTEEYKVLKGKLELYVDDEKIVLNEHDSYTIKPGKRHYAIGNETWFEARSTPGWMIEDHILDNKN